MRQRGLVQSRLDQPFTYTPEIISGMKAGATEQAQGAYEGALGQSLERAGAAGGYRGGAQRGTERRLAQGLGGTIANLNREIDTQAAMQRGVDIQNAVGLATPVLNSQYQFPRDIANVYSGASVNPIWQQPSPFAQLASGVGGLGGSILGAGALGAATGGPGLAGIFGLGAGAGGASRSLLK